MRGTGACRGQLRHAGRMSAPRPNALADAFARIHAVVLRIPPGCVATYGQVAAEAGFARRARLAGQALAATPPGLDLPWHRVVNAQGRISLPPGSPGHREQARRLQAEGVRFRGARIDLERFGWRPRGPAPVLD